MESLGANVRAFWDQDQCYTYIAQMMVVLGNVIRAIFPLARKFPAVSGWASEVLFSMLLSYFDINQNVNTKPNFNPVHFLH